MKLKMDEATLMAYLYGELSVSEKSEVEKYLQENQEALKAFHELQFVHEAISKIHDKEVIAPPIFMSEDKPIINFWQSGFFRYVSGIAAAFLVVMIGAKLLGVEMHYSGNEFILSFGEVREAVTEPTLSPEQVQAMINSSLSKNNDAVQMAWTESQNKMDEAIKQNTLFASKKMAEVGKNANVASQEEIRRFMQGLRTENNQVIQEYIRLSSNDQKQYIENLLIDFSKYMQEQRNQDLNMVQNKIQTLEQDNNQFRQEAGQILTSLISDNNSSVKRN